MEQIRITEGLVSSRLIYGCMRIPGDKSPEAIARGKQAIVAAWEAGYNHFDHADIYGNGKSEEMFGEVLREVPGMRQKVIITTKCGVRRKDTPYQGDPVRYDFSREHIFSSIEGSLRRMGIDTIDLYLLHRPDFLMNPEEVAEVFSSLHKSGKVRYFGVSNFRPSQVSMLQAWLSMPIVVNQVEINIHNASAFSDGTLDQCLERRIIPEAWCPLGGVAYEAWGNTFSDEDKNRIRAEIAIQSEKYGVEPWQLILAWILKHPAGICPVIGSTTPERIRTAKEALDFQYCREDWYRLLEARNGKPLP